MIELFWIALFSMIMAFGGTGLTRRFAIRNKLYDIPNDRSSHSIPTPRGGGLGIVVSSLFSLCGFFYFGHISNPFFGISLLGGGMIAFIGAVDDYKSVPAYLRLIIHFTAFGLALYFFGGGPGIQIFESVIQPSIIVNIIYVFSLVWLLNLFNFMDGIDGIASVESISVIGAALIISYFLNGETVNGWLMFALLLNCCGFIVWNWPPARIFLGDVGSGFLGFILGIFVLRTSLAGELSLWVWIILLAVFWVDATLTLSKRLIRFEKVYEAHRSHAYQHAALKYGSHKKVTVAVLIINLLWLFPLASVAAIVPGYGWLITMIACVPIFTLAIKLDAGKKGFQIGN